jgi:hypothetical protein
MHYVGFILNYLVLGEKENIVFKIQTKRDNTREQVGFYGDKEPF